ncbi:MAG: basic rane protein [Actinomycetota bacterium]|jgi:basic membrane protein A|nr:basic rane protein [Actinomycetota bacterium]
MKIVALASVAAIALAGCGSSKESAPSASDKTTSAAKTLKVGMAFDVGGRGDGTFNDLAVKGLEKAKTEFGAEIKELSPKEDGSDRADLLRQLADDGYNPIVGVGFSYGEALDTVAKEYPEISFVRIDGGPTKVPNAAVASFAEQEGSYLVGVAAALKSKTDHIGFIGGNESALINKFYAGYKLGATAAKPGIKVDDKRLAAGDDGAGFGNIPGAKVAAQAMYQNGADVIYTAAGGSFNGSFPVAATMKKLAIGVDSDQFNTVGNADWKKVILTSMVKQVDSAVFGAVKEFKETGKVKSQSFSLKDGGVDYSTSGGFVNDIKAKIDGYKTKIIKGEIKVPETL